MKLVRALSILIGIAGILVLIGWDIDNDILKGLHHGFSTMRPATALMFIISSGLLLFQTMKSSIYSAFFIAMFSMFLVMGTFWCMVMVLNASPSEISTRLEFMPSPISLIAFLMVATSGFVAVLNTNEMFKRLRLIGILILSIGLMGIFGYTIKEEFFYFYFANLENGMGLNTAILFVVVGITIQLISYQLLKRKQNATA